MSLNQGKQSPVDFAERVSWEPAEAQGRSKIELRLHRLWVRLLRISGLHAASPKIPNVSVLLLEAGGSDEMPSVTEAARWFENLGSERDWKFVDQPNPHLKRTFHTARDGQGSRRGIEHQCDGLRART